ncbi:MAG: carbon-nitrogen hydrolase family protein [Deltaproteobacteria bacterium]|nr:carbon-nitrogen hydrolase family protein [Deltaproteobacteria bacterium]
MLLVAAIQMTAGPERAANEARALALVEKAAERGAKFVGLPEMWEHIGPASQKAQFAGPVEGAQLARLREVVTRRGIWCLAGSIAEKSEDGRFYNTSALIAPDGSIAATYRKLHLFDVDIPDGARYRESEQVAQGAEKPPVVELTGVGLKLGMSICYDLRFPELYRTLAERGADLIAVPAAFTAYTGKAHWEVLLRARAIEDQAFVIAPAQVGQIGPPEERRLAWGHAAIIDPWGELLGDAGSTVEGVVVAELKKERLAQVRRDLPALSHRRKDVL